MIAEYYRPSRKSDFYSAAAHIGRGKCTYASCLEYLDQNGIIVKMLSQAAASRNIGDTAMNAIRDVADHTDRPTRSDQEDLFERGLLRYRKWWGKSEADVFVNGDMLTGILMLADKNTLRVKNESHSYLIPIEKIECIRTTDGLSARTQNGLAGMMPTA